MKGVLTSSPHDRTVVAGIPASHHYQASSCGGSSLLVAGGSAIKRYLTNTAHVVIQIPRPERNSMPFLDFALHACSADSFLLPCYVADQISAFIV